jgi:hypothetical protein
VYELRKLILYEEIEEGVNIMFMQQEGLPQRGRLLRCPEHASQPTSGHGRGGRARVLQVRQGTRTATRAQ